MSAAIRVVVVTYSPGEELSEFLSSLAGATRRSHEVILADNGSTDGSVEAAALAEPTRVRVTRTGGNLGYGAAANVGAAANESEWLLIANPDIVFTPGSLDLLIEAADRWPDAGAFGPLIRTPDGELYPSARELPTLGRGIGHALFGWWWPSNPWTASYRRERQAPVEGPCGWLSGSILLVRPEAWLAVDGFDRDYFMYFEDVDLGARLVRAGWRSVYVPSAVVTHAGGHSTKHNASPMLKAHHASAMRYLSRRYTGARYAPLRAVLRIGLQAHYLLSIRFRAVAQGAAPRRTYSENAD